MVTLLIRTVGRLAPLTPPVASPKPPARDRTVYLPPAAELRRLIPAPPARPAPPRPTPVPTPPPREARDRISIGAPSELRQERLLLERDKDLSSKPAAPGRPGALATPSPTAEARTDPPAGEPGATATPRPAGRGEAPLVTPRSGDRPITSSLRKFDQRLGQMGAGGLSGAAGQQMGPLFFDPEGADFTAWINHFKNEVYRNWIVPQAALFGAVGGHVDFAFTVARDGSVAEVRLLKSSGTTALDRAAGNALFGARLLPLPSDFGPSTVTMQISFYYGEERS
jgi:TonB family protein